MASDCYFWKSFICNLVSILEDYLSAAKNFGFVLTVAIVTVIITYNNAYAYLDPGTGSYLLQLLLAGLLGGLLAIKMFWRNLKAFFAKLFSKSSDVGPDQ